MKEAVLEQDLKLLILDKVLDREYIKEHMYEIFNILSLSYQKIGGCYIYESPQHMSRTVARYKIVVDQNNNNIFAIATYRHFNLEDSYKCILIGRNFNLDQEVGKAAVQWIIKSDIINWKNLYWIEAYDAVGHWEEMYGAFKIPSAYVPNILGHDVKILYDDEDIFKYYRQIKGLDKPQPKIMFGFNSKESIDKLLDAEAFTAYENAIKELYDGKVHDSIFESHHTDNRYEAVARTLYFIEDRYYEQREFRNITPGTLDLIIKVRKEALHIAKTYDLKKEAKEELLMLCDLCKKIILHACVLQPHKLNL